MAQHSLLIIFSQFLYFLARFSTALYVSLCIFDLRHTHSTNLTHGRSLPPVFLTLFTQKWQNQVVLAISIRFCPIDTFFCLSASTRFTTVNIYCQLFSVTTMYPKLHYTSLTHFSPFSLIFNTFNPFFDRFFTCFRTSPRVANPLHLYSANSAHLRSPQPILDLIYTKTTFSSDFWPRGMHFLHHSMRFAPISNYWHQMSTDLSYY